MNVALFSYEIFCLFNCLVLLLDDKGVFEVCHALLHFVYPAPILDVSVNFRLL